jgi:hypothetical protein
MIYATVDESGVIGTANSTVHRCDFRPVGGGMADGGLSGTLVIEKCGAESGGLDKLTSLPTE